MAPTSHVLSPPPSNSILPNWSLYNSPPPPPPLTASWTPDNPFQISLPCPSRSPATSPLLSPTSVRNEPSMCGSDPPSTPRSTHEIWSVRNAVTMDEDRNTVEVIPRSSTSDAVF